MIIFLFFIIAIMYVALGIAILYFLLATLKFLDFPGLEN